MRVYEEDGKWKLKKREESALIFIIGNYEGIENCNMKQSGFEFNEGVIVCVVLCCIVSCVELNR